MFQGIVRFNAKGRDARVVYQTRSMLEAISIWDTWKRAKDLDCLRLRGWLWAWRILSLSPLLGISISVSPRPLPQDLLLTYFLCTQAALWNGQAGKYLLTILKILFSYYQSLSTDDDSLLCYVKGLLHMG